MNRAWNRRRSPGWHRRRGAWVPKGDVALEYYAQQARRAEWRFTAVIAKYMKIAEEARVEDFVLVDG